MICKYFGHVNCCNKNVNVRERVVFVLFEPDTCSCLSSLVLSSRMKHLHVWVHTLLQPIL